MRGIADRLEDAMEPSAQIFVNLGLIHRDGKVIRYWDSFLSEMEIRDWALAGWYVWDKLNAMPGAARGHFQTSHEWVFHFARENVKIVPVVPTKYGGQMARGGSQRLPDGSLDGFHTPGPVNALKVAESVIRTPPVKDNPRDGHPAPFPVALPKQCVESWQLEYWYDPFLGSGTTLIACEQLGRRCYAMEIEPKYVDVAVKRWEQFTGQTAVLEVRS
jgi:DNA modification methylase